MMAVARAVDGRQEPLCLCHQLLKGVLWLGRGLQSKGCWEKEGGACGWGGEVPSPLGAWLLVIYLMFRSTCDAAGTFILVMQLRTMITQHTV